MPSLPLFVIILFGATSGALNSLMTVALINVWSYQNSIQAYLYSAFHIMFQSTFTENACFNIGSILLLARDECVKC